MTENETHADDGVPVPVVIYGLARPGPLAAGGAHRFPASAGHVCRHDHACHHRRGRAESPAGGPRLSHQYVAGGKRHRNAASSHVIPWFRQRTSLDHRHQFCVHYADHRRRENRWSAPGFRHVADHGGCPAGARAVPAPVATRLLACGRGNGRASDRFVADPDQHVRHPDAAAWHPRTLHGVDGGGRGPRARRDVQRPAPILGAAFGGAARVDRRISAVRGGRRCAQPSSGGHMVRPAASAQIRTRFRRAFYSALSASFTSSRPSKRWAT